ncbi:MAG: Fe-S cluster assembly protein SufB [Mycoplasmataceae bacterium]|nr:Fe-S cluster assembly protein SufB [Mycoplasmataceae bacterium]
MDYQYGFTTKIKNNILFKKGLNLKVIKKISEIKKEPKWMFDFRLQAYKNFLKLKNPNWGIDISFIDFNDYIYFASALKNEANDKIPDEIKETFNKLGIDEKEQQILSGINEQFDSQTVFHELIKEIKQKKIIFCGFDEAIQKHGEIVKKYLGKLVNSSDNKYAALNSCVCSGGSFLYVPKNTILDKPLQSYFRINTKSLGQFERTLIIIEEGCQVHYIEGCTAPVYDKNNLHAAVVEVFINQNSKFRYSTIQNWSKNVLNLVTKRAILEKNSFIEWVDGNVGSLINMKYPCSILKGDNSNAKCISIATCNKNMKQDTGAKMIHLGKNTRSQIISKTISSDNGISNFRGLVKITKNAINSFSSIECDTLLLDQTSSSDTIPKEIVENNSSFIKHEAKISNIDKELLFYLNSKGFDEKKAKQLFSLGFIKPFTDLLPLEYAVELNRLLKEII